MMINRGLSILKSESELKEQEDALFEQLESSASILGDCNPLWLKERRIPNFESTKNGSKGEKVLLLHGLFGAMSNWDDLIPFAKNELQLEALSFPLIKGHKSEVRVRDLALYTECFLRTHYQEPITLCGNSLGGHVALLVALHHPELVKSLILSGSSGLYEHVVSGMPVRPAPEFWRGQLERVFYNQDFVTEERLNEVVEVLKDRSTFLKILSTARSAKHDNLQDVLTKIPHPTLLLWGANDEVTPVDVANTFKSLLPNATLVLVDNCGHAPMIEHPKWFAQEMIKFLKR